MKTTDKILSLILSLSLALTLIIPLAEPIFASAEGDVILIENAEDFISFAKSCSYDLYSKGKTFRLGADIDLTGLDFYPVPVFSGRFEGAGHTISGVNLSSATSPTGLFSILEKDGVIEGLTVIGSVSPEGDALCVGGIVGENHGIIEKVSFIGSVVGSQNVGGIAGKNALSGSITDCQVSAEIIGEEATGGIAGCNEGIISSSVSEAKVNTIAITPTLTLNEINVSLTLDITKLPTLSGVTMTDVGGIAGYSTGIILSSVNNGRVGYPHVGYNVGGIAGRSCGHINGCINNAEIFGRKDVGGIVGHMEPYVNYELGEDLLLNLKSELDRLSNKLGLAIGEADDSLPSISTRLDSIITNIDGATDSLDTILGDAGEYGDDMTGEINRISQVLQETVKQISSVTEELPELAELLSSGLNDLDGALDDLDAAVIIGITTLKDLAEMTKNSTLALESIESALDNLSLGLELLKSSIELKDQAKAEKAIDDIIDGLFNIVNKIGGLAEAVDDSLNAIGNNAWMSDAFDEAERLALSLGKTADAINEIYDAALEIKENININWSEIISAGDDIKQAIENVSSAMADMELALSLMESAMVSITDGIDGLIDSAEIKDADAAKDAAGKLVKGLDELVDAVTKGASALENLSDAINNSGSSDILDKISAAFSELSSSGTEGAAAFSKITAALRTISENIELDVDKLTDSGTLVIVGVKDMNEALHNMRSAVTKMNLGMKSVKDAVATLTNALSIDDDKKIADALDSLITAIGTVGEGAKEITEILHSTVNIMREAKLWGDEVIDSLSDVATAANDITNAILGLYSSVDSLRDSVELDADLTKGGLEAIILALSDTADSAEHLKNALLYFYDTIDEIEGIGNKLSDMVKNLSDGVSKIARAMQLLSGISEDIHGLIKYLMSVDPVQLPTPPESITDEANRLFIYISKIESELKQLNSDVTETAGELLAILGDINEIFDNISENIIDVIYGLESGDSISNRVAESEIDSVTHGKVFASENYGKVEGDRNVGGISGAMGLEYSLDPEDDLSPSLSVTQKKQYRLKAVIHRSKNYGEIIAKYDAAGGITGKMDFGLIYLSEAYGRVESTAGNYVGGIAGIASGRISSCFAKCTLAGGSYIGGILGSGVSEDMSGGSSSVAGCYSMIEITRATQYFGAIAGVNRGEYSENYFISKNLSGIDRVSYGGKAEPIGYDELIKRRYIPDGFYSFTLKFVADGVVISTHSFTYGESLDQSVFPAIPAKDGHYGVWDRNELSDLRFDTTVNVVYTPYVITIAGGDRGDGRDVFLVEGEFTANDRLTASVGIDTSDLVLSSGIFTKEALVESWTLTIPKDNVELNRVHLLPSTDHARVFVKTTDGWVQAEAEEFGSYLTFNVSGETIEIAVVRHTVNILTVIILSAIAFMAIGAVVIVAIVRRKKKKI